MPAGLTLDTNGNLSWTPTTDGTYDFTVRVIDETQQATLGLSLTVNSIPMIPLSQRNALIALYNSTNGAGWDYNANWRNAGDTDFNDPGTECTWIFVSCNPEGTRIESITLLSNNLTGTIPT